MSLYAGSLVIKSMAMSSQTAVGGVIRCKILMMLEVNISIVDKLCKNSQNFLKSFRMPCQNICVSRLNVLLTPASPPIGVSCHSSKTNFFSDKFLPKKGLPL